MTPPLCCSTRILSQLLCTLLLCNFNCKALPAGQWEFVERELVGVLVFFGGGVGLLSLRSPLGSLLLLLQMSLVPHRIPVCVFFTPAQLVCFCWGLQDKVFLNSSLLK